MYRARLIPVLLLKGRGLVKTVNFRGEKYIGDPLNAVKIFNDKGVDELFFVDIAASRTGGGINFDILSKIAAQSFMPLGYGGGVRSVDDAKRVFELGFEKVSVNSQALKRPELINELAARFGSQSIVSSIDVKKVASGYCVYDHVSGKATGMDPVAFARRVQECGAGEIVVNSVDRDGMMGGYDLELIRKVSSASSVPVIALGGAGVLADFEAALGAGASAVAAGSMFVFYGPHRAVLINYPDFGV